MIVNQLRIIMHHLLTDYDSVIELHSKTWVTFGAFAITVAGWFVWLLILNSAYALKEQLAYNVRWGFISDFGPMLEWWLTAWSVVTAFLIFDCLIAYLRKIVYPSDTDVFQELEKDPVLRKRFEESCRDVLCEEQIGKGSFEEQKKKDDIDEMEERRREDEVSDLLRARERQVTEERRNSLERSSSFSPFGAMKRQISYEQKGRKSTDGGMLTLTKTRGSITGRSTKGRPSMDSNRRASGDRLGMGLMRKKSEMGAEMTVMEEGTGTIGSSSTAPGSVRSEPSSAANKP